MQHTFEKDKNNNNNRRNRQKERYSMSVPYLLLHRTFIFLLLSYSPVQTIDFAFVFIQKKCNVTHRKYQNYPIERRIVHKIYTHKIFKHKIYKRNETKRKKVYENNS